MYARVTIPDWLRTGKTIAGIYPRWLFRGQPSASWGLQTTLERAAIQKNLAFAHTPDHAKRLTKQALDELPNREAWIVTQFRRRAHLVMSSPPSADAQLEWLAAIQHYGGPTRLLDFTHSFYIATFFAVERATEDAAVWAFWAPCIEKTNGITEDRLDKMNEQAIEIVQGVLGGDSSRLGVLSVEPSRLNERMAVQKGVFLLPLDITKTFMSNLMETFEFDFEAHDDPKHDMRIAELLSRSWQSGPHAVKFIFPRIEHKLILDDLASMNIDASTLFPGLEGYARSMYRHI